MFLIKIPLKPKAGSGRPLFRALPLGGFRRMMISGKKRDSPRKGKANGLAKQPPPLEGWPLQCFGLKAKASEWYGPRGVRHDKKQRFVRAWIRKAVIVPVTSGYPHLTIDVDHVIVDRKFENVTLKVYKIHYSHSKNSPRIFFSENGKSGEFVADEAYPNLSEVVRKVRIWLADAGIPIIIREPKAVGLAEPVAGPYSLPESLERKLELESKPIESESSPEEEKSSSDSVTKSSGRSGKKKKKARKKLSTSEKMELFDDLELEEDLKFGDFSALLGVKEMSQLSWDAIKVIMTVQVIFATHCKTHNLLPLMDRVDKEKREWLRKLDRYFRSQGDKPSGRKPSELLSWFFMRNEASEIPKIRDYSISMFIPDLAGVLDLSDSRQNAIFKISLKSVMDTFGIQLAELRVTELCEFSSAVCRFLQQTNSPASFFRLIAYVYTSMLSKFWEAIPEDNMLSFGTMTLSVQEADAKMEYLDRYWDDQTSQILELNEKVMRALELWRDLPADVVSGLDQKAGKFLERFDRDKIQLALLERLLNDASGASSRPSSGLKSEATGGK
ncbi:hypothetical protein FUAX_00110 [Fulvitalea axinellae]|uniref:Uncharacterized protein n=1 Tax=Fulvitalea axinellae TaxID=1182444 RepID=A0AAU9CZK6_9BACT|nr:hypothetical protein FUAX_00110 [Fulvitalea axinellae]